MDKTKPPSRSEHVPVPIGNLRDAIKALLLQWQQLLGEVDDHIAVWDSADAIEVSDEEKGHLLNLDRHLMGVALFLKDVADKADDMELLGLATRAQRIAQEKITEEEKRFTEDQQQQEGSHEAWRRTTNAVESACRPVFASIGQAGVDMSKHRKAIEDSRPYFNKPSDYVGLLIHADERKVFRKVCKEVLRNTKDYARNNNSNIPPDREWIQGEFRSVLSKAYRNADKYVAQRIKRCTPNSPISPPSSSEE